MDGAAAVIVQHPVLVHFIVSYWYLLWPFGFALASLLLRCFCDCCCRDLCSFGLRCRLYTFVVMLAVAVFVGVATLIIYAFSPFLEGA